MKNGPFFVKETSATGLAPGKPAYAVLNSKEELVFVVFNMKVAIDLMEVLNENHAARIRLAETTAKILSKF